jgi:hypothetical protein
MRAVSANYFPWQLVRCSSLGGGFRAAFIARTNEHRQARARHPERQGEAELTRATHHSYALYVDGESLFTLLRVYRPTHCGLESAAECERGSRALR